MTLVQQLITEECRQLEQLLLDKNRKYGNSALNPKRIFSKASVAEQLHVRIDDKLSRIEAGHAGEVDEDTVLDLIGYLILLRVSEKLKVGGHEAKVVKKDSELALGGRVRSCKEKSRLGLVVGVNTSDSHWEYRVRWDDGFEAWYERNELKPA